MKVLKLLIGLYLLPVSWIFTQVSYYVLQTAFPFQTFLTDKILLPLVLGIVIWFIVFLLLPPPMRVYVFGHELTHAIWSVAMGGKILGFRSGKKGGAVKTTRSNFLIALAPYFFPLYTLIVVLLFGLVRLWVRSPHYDCWFVGAIGFTWAFHLTFTIYVMSIGQSDITDNGWLFSLVIIYIFNLIGVDLLLILLSPNVSFAGFLASLTMEARKMVEWILHLLPNG